MSSYIFDRSERGLLLVLKNTNNDVTEEFELLRITFEKLSMNVKSFNEFEPGNGDKDIYSKLRAFDFGEYNLFVLIALSDCQAGFEVFQWPKGGRGPKSSTFHIGKLAQCVAENRSIFGRPKILIFDSYDLANTSASLVNEDLEGTNKDVMINGYQYKMSFQNTIRDFETARDQFN